MIGEHVAQQSTPTAQRALQRAVAQRRWRVWRNLAIFGLVTTIMVLLSMAQRDELAVRSCHERLAFSCTELERLLKDGQVAPLRLPLPSPPAPGPNASPAERERAERDTIATRDHYFYNAHYGRPQAQGHIVGVCCCRAAHRLYLRPDGRHVVVFDGQRYDLRWMSEPEFRASMAALGLKPPD